MEKNSYAREPPRIDKQTPIKKIPCLSRLGERHGGIKQRSLHRCELQLFYYNKVIIMTKLAKIMLIALTLGAFGIYLTSCNKSELLENASSIHGYHLNQTPLSDLVVNSEDEEDERVKSAMVIIATSLKGIVQKPIYKDYILAEAQKTSYDAVLLSDFIIKFPESLEIINTELQGLSGDLKNTLSLEELIEQLLYENVEYNPVIHVPNINFADIEKMPILSPGVEVPDDEVNNVDDHYFFWFFDENGNEYEVTVGEEQAKSEGAAPAFVLSLLDESDISNLVAGVNEVSVVSAPISLRNFSVATNEFKLDKRYESSGRSEFYYAARLTISTSPGIPFYLGNKNGNEITKVRKRDIGEDLGKWTTWFPYEDNIESIVFNTFERDWAHSKKVLGKLILTGGNEEYFSGNRCFTTDCYWETDVYNNTNITNPLDVDYFVNPNNWGEEYEGDEGDLTFWKIQ